MRIRSEKRRNGKTENRGNGKNKGNGGKRRGSRVLGTTRAIWIRYIHQRERFRPPNARYPLLPTADSFAPSRMRGLHPEEPPPRDSGKFRAAVQLKMK